MERSKQPDGECVVELGIASCDTRGGLGEIIEPMGLWHKAGISDE